jgi:Sulfotransferase domain
MKQSANGTMRRAARALVQAGRVLAGQQIAGRNLTVFPDDVFLTSYPRSGNTWTRFLIGNLIFQEEPVTFANIEERIPEIYFNPDHAMRRIPRPRILKSHECFQPQYPRIIYVVRDPRDVAVSFYHHNVKARNIPDEYPMEAFIPRFIAAEFDSKWGSWSDNVLSWLALRENHPGFILLRYETMKENPMQELMRLTAFLERCSFRKLDTGAEKLQRAIDLSSPENMRKLEKAQAANWVLTKNTRADKPFVRTAKAGGWRSTLSPESVAKIESAWGPLMQRLGYALAGNSITDRATSTVSQAQSRS